MSGARRGVLVALVAALFGACGGSRSVQESGERPSAAKGPICMVSGPAETAYSEGARRGAEEAAAELGATLEYARPTAGQGATQGEAIEELVEQRCSAIAVAADDAEAVAPAMRKAKEAGIAVSAWRRDVAEDARDVYVGESSPGGVARALVDAMAEQADGRGDFLAVTGSPTAADERAWLGEMRSYMSSKYPDMEIVEVVTGERLERALAVTGAYLRANTDTAGVFATSSVALQGAARAVERWKPERRIPVTGVALPSVIRSHVRRGTVNELVPLNPVDLGYLAVHVAYAQAHGDNPTAATTFRAGRLGRVAVTSKDEIVLGEPLG